MCNARARIYQYWFSCLQMCKRIPVFSQPQQLIWNRKAINNHFIIQFISSKIAFVRVTTIELSELTLKALNKKQYHRITHLHLIHYLWIQLFQNNCKLAELALCLSINKNHLNYEYEFHFNLSSFTGNLN